MALTVEELGYGSHRNTTPPEVESERSVAGKENLGPAVGDIVERINFTIGEDQIIRPGSGGFVTEVPKIDHAKMGRPVNKQYERNRQSVVTRLKAIGVHVATVVNFLPIPLRSDSLLGPSKAAKIPPPKDQQPYGTFVFKEAYIEPARTGVDSPLLAIEWHPIQMANEFSHMNTAGVFSFLGVPQDLQDPKWLGTVSTEPDHNGQTYGAALELCRQQSVSWMQEKLREGNDLERQNRQPQEPQKASARRLYHLGLIKEMPKWVEKQTDVTVKIPVCPNCQKPGEVGAPSCTTPNCNYILDPRKAYEIGAIGEDHLSLERLTRAEVKEMGISDYVVETRDEKKERLKHGGIKPVLSIAAMRIADANDDIDDAKRAKSATLTGEALGRVLTAKETKAEKEKPSKE